MADGQERVAASAPGRDLLLTTLQETGEIQWPMGWPLSWLLDLIDTLGLAPDEISLEGTRIRVMQHA